MGLSLVAEILFTPRTHVYRTTFTHVIWNFTYVHLHIVFLSTLGNRHPTLSLLAVCWLLYIFLEKFWCHWLYCIFEFQTFSFLNHYKIIKTIKSVVSLSKHFYFWSCIECSPGGRWSVAWGLFLTPRGQLKPRGRGCNFRGWGGGGWAGNF